MSDPKQLSVVIPAYNASRTIATTISTAWAVGASEVIVVDDGSTDDTGIIAARLGCTLIVQTNKGAAEARRRGIEVSSNEFIILLDADDQVVEEGAREALHILRTRPDVGMVLGRTIGVLGNGCERYLNMWPEGVTQESLLGRGHAPGPPASFVWRTSVLRQIVAPEPGGIWPRFAEDYEFLLRGARLSPIVSHNKISSRYSWSGGKSSSRPLASVTDADRIRVYYSRLAGGNATPRSAIQLRSQAFMRKASGSTGLNRLLLLAIATSLHPPSAWQRVRRSLAKMKRSR